MDTTKHYDLRIHNAAETELAGVIGNDANSVMDRITDVQNAKDVTTVDGVDYLRDYEDLIRIKSGQYRIILRVKRRSMQLILLAVGKRNTVYNSLERISERSVL